MTAVLTGAALVAEIPTRRMARGDTRRAHRMANALMAAALAAYAAGRNRRADLSPRQLDPVPRAVARSAAPRWWPKHRPR